MKNIERKEKKQGKKRRGWIIAVVVLAWLLLMVSLAMLADARTVRFYMNGEPELTIEQGTDYTEPGIYAVTTGKLFGESKKQLPLHTVGQVDTDIVGSYNLEYTVENFFGTFSTSRRVNVVDTQAPVIELKYVEGYSPSWIDGYVEEGYSAWDSYDGDISDKVSRQQYADKIIYTVEDSSGNAASVERPMPDYTDMPLITINGGEYVELYAGETYQEPGYSAMDGLGNDLTGHIVTEGEVYTRTAGDYYISYSLVSGSGETVSTTRCVRVLPQPMPEIIIPEGRSIYLTFDDGPGPYTGRLLDILSAYGVPATFFVTAADSRYYDLIGRAYREGHSVGVHTSTHNYSQIYSSEDAWFEDFFNMQEIIYQQTGEYTKLFRFPGGSSNTVSSFNPGIMSRLAEIMTDMGYKFFDWNVGSGDAGETNNTQEIVENIIGGCTGKNVSIVLQHDIKDYSISAVEQVIIWGRNNGYTFRALDMTSPEAHHGINN